MNVNKAYKSTIIRKYGTNVTIQKYAADKPVTDIPDKVLLGRNTRNNVNMFKLTHQKEGIFLPESKVEIGDYVVNPSHREEYLVVGHHQEYDRNYLLSNLTGLMKCEHTLDVKRMEEYADERGNIKTRPVDAYKDVPCYLEYVSGNLRQMEPGLNSETEYKVYVTDLHFKENDMLTIKGYNFEYHCTALALDYMSFPRLLVMEVKRDKVRKNG